MTRFVSLMPLMFVLLAVFSLIASPAWAQNMGDPGMGQDQPEPDGDGTATQPAPGDDGMGDDGTGTDGDGEMGPFHRPNPGHNPDSTLPSGPNQPPDFEELIDVVSKGLGFEGETAERFREILLGAEEAKRKAREEHQRARAGSGQQQLEALGQFLTEAQIQSITRLFQGFERYKQQAGQLARMRASGALSQADHDDKRGQLDALAEQFIRNQMPADGVEGFLEYWRQAVTGEATGGEDRLLDEIGKAYGLSVADRMRFKLIARSRKRLEGRTDADLQQKLRAIEQDQNEQLQDTLTAEQLERLAVLHQTSEGYKAAMRELQALAGKPGVTKEEIAEQRRKITRTVHDQFRELIADEHYARFIDVWERAIRARTGG